MRHVREMLTSASYVAPPTNESMFEGWSIGPIFYSVLAVAEALGPSNTSRVMDLGANNGSIYTPAYAIYENGTLARLALFNYVTDPSGGSSTAVTISVGGGQIGEPVNTPQSVKVKYLAAESVSVKENITWAGQVRQSFYNPISCVILKHSPDTR